jgi:hypothetical protein
LTFVIVGAAAAGRLGRALAVFESAGFAPIDDLDGLADVDAVLGVVGGGADLLRDADSRGVRYVLVHDGGSDQQPGGTFERAHHRVEAAQLDELARHLRSRVRPLVSCLAFGYKNGVPGDAGLMVDARFLDNPYWVPELRDLDGRDPAVRGYVMRQPAAGRLLDDMERMVRDLLPLYNEKGRMHLVVAFGCTGGQHRSVVLASELARRLEQVRGVDVELVTRDV